MITTSIVFDHRGRTQKGHEGPLEVRIINNRKVYYVATGVKVLRNEWKFGEVVNRPDADVLNERLNIISSSIADEVNYRLERRMAIDVAEIKRAVWSIRYDSGESVSAPALDWIEKQIPLLDVCEGTKKHYKTMYACVRAYGCIRCWKDFTAENIYRFDAYLRERKKPQTDAQKLARSEPEPIGKSAVYNYHKNLKSILNRAVKMGYLERNPYDRLRGEFDRGDKENVEFLTENEMLMFMAVEPTGAMEALAKDLFIFQMYTGLSYSDMMAFNAKEYKLIDGKWRHTGERVKTGVAFVSTLLPPAVSILEKYGWHVPHLSNQKYNLALKGLGAAAGIGTRLHSHLARHTFATMMLRNGAKIENVSKMLGHAKITQTQIYAKVVAQSVHDDYDMVAEKMGLAEMKPIGKGRKNGEKKGSGR